MVQGRQKISRDLRGSFAIFEHSHVFLTRTLMIGGEVIVAGRPVDALDSKCGRDLFSLLLDLNNSVIPSSWLLMIRLWCLQASFDLLSVLSVGPSLFGQCRLKYFPSVLQCRFECSVASMPSNAVSGVVLFRMRNPVGCKSAAHPRRCWLGGWLTQLHGARQLEARCAAIPACNEAPRAFAGLVFLRRSVMLVGVSPGNSGAVSGL